MPTPAAREAAEAGVASDERLARDREPGCGPPRSPPSSRWRQSPSDARTCWCWRRRSACCAPWEPRTRPARRSPLRFGSPTTGCTRARARGCGSCRGESRELEQVTATLAVPAFVVAQPPTGCGRGHAPRRAGTLAIEFMVSPRRWGVRSTGTSMIAATSHWGGYRWGPQRLPEAQRGRPPGGAPLHLRGDAAPGRADRPEPVAPRRRRVGVLRDPALPAGRPAASGELAHHAAHRGGARRRDHRPGGQLRAAPARRHQRRGRQRRGGRRGEHSRRGRPCGKRPRGPPHPGRRPRRAPCPRQDQPGTRTRLRGQAPATAAGAARAGAARLARPARGAGTSGSGPARAR